MLRSIVLLLAALGASSAAAQQYRWVDDKGRVHYSDTPPPASAKSAQKKNLKGNAIGQQPNYELSQAMKSSPVTLYSHPDCTDYCQMARDVLNRRGIPFTEISATDEAKLAQLKRVSGAMKVPVLVVGAQVETTISADAFNQVLDLAGYPKAGVAAARKQSAPPAPKPPAPSEPGAQSSESAAPR